jgi:hypothetical protein
MEIESKYLVDNQQIGRLTLDAIVMNKVILEKSVGVTL